MKRHAENSGWCQYSSDLSKSGTYLLQKMKRLACGIVLAGLNIIYGASTDDLLFEFNHVDGTATIIGCDTNATGTLLIPNNYNSHTITKIGAMAFRDCQFITKVNIPDSVTSIGNLAFFRCSSLSEITVSNQLQTINFGAFYNCTGLKEITLPATVTEIGTQAFMNCSQLSRIYCLTATAPTVGDQVFNSDSDSLPKGAILYVDPSATGYGDDGASWEQLIVNKTDSNSNGINDTYEMSLFIRQLTEDFALSAAARMSDYGYYDASQIQDARPGSILIAVTDDNKVTLTLQLERSDDHVNWTKDTDDLVSIDLELDQDKAFFRFAIHDRHGK